MNWRVSTPPESEPIKLSEAKLHLRIDHPDEDDLIKSLIVSARLHVENICERALMPQTWELACDQFPDIIYLPGGNLRQINTITYRDADDAAQTLDSNSYNLDSFSVPARVAPAVGVSWPATANRINAVVVNYNVGYENAAAIPAALKSAMLLIIGELYENREMGIVGTIYTPTGTVSSLIWPYRRVIP